MSKLSSLLRGRQFPTPALHVEWARLQPTSHRPGRAIDTEEQQDKCLQAWIGVQQLSSFLAHDCVTHTTGNCIAVRVSCMVSVSATI